MKVFLGLLVFLGPLIGSCSESPILNHKNGDDVTFSSPMIDSSQKPEACANLIEKLGLCLVGTWEAAPQVSNEKASVLIIGFYNLQREALQSALSIEAVMWMPDMGHGSMPTHVKRLQNSQGVLTHEYRISEMYFLMPGHWQIILKIEDENGQLAESIVDVNLK